MVLKPGRELSIHKIVAYRDWSSLNFVDFKTDSKKKKARIIAYIIFCKLFSKLK